MGVMAKTPTQMMTLRIPCDLARRMNEHVPRGKRSKFIAAAIEVALDGQRVYAKGFEAAKQYMLESSAREMRQYHDALLLVRDGVSIPDALQQVFKARYDTLAAIGQESERFRNEVNRDR